MPSRRYIGGFVFLLFFCWKKVWAKYSKIIHLPFFPLFEGNSLSAWWNWWRNLFLTHKHTDTNLPPFFKRTFCCFEGLVFFGLSYPTCDISLDARVVLHRFTATVHLFCNHFFILEFFPNKKLYNHCSPLRSIKRKHLCGTQPNPWQFLTQLHSPQTLEVTIPTRFSPYPPKKGHVIAELRVEIDTPGVKMSFCAA